MTSKSPWLVKPSGTGHITSSRRLNRSRGSSASPRSTTETYSSCFPSRNRGTLTSIIPGSSGWYRALMMSVAPGSKVPVEGLRDRPVVGFRSPNR